MRHSHVGVNVAAATSIAATTVAAVAAVAPAAATAAAPAIVPVAAPIPMAMHFTLSGLCVQFSPFHACRNACPSPHMHTGV